jgi:hypothetical protein
MDDFLKTHYSDYFFIIPSRDTQITAREISSSNLTASLAKTHQLFKLKKQLENKNTHHIQMLRSFSRNIKGSDNFWRSRTKDLQHWITHHVARGHGHPAFFITLSCAGNWWIDLKHLLAQLEDTAQNYLQAEAIRDGSMIAMSIVS